jgi:putative redox protein
MALVIVKGGTTNYAVAVTAGNHAWIADEPPRLGGKDAGPAPYDLLLGSLGACTAITLRMYVERKQWPVQSIDVDLRLVRDDGQERIERVVTVGGDLTAEQRTRIGEIAEKTPVTLTLKRGVTIATQLR